MLIPYPQQTDVYDVSGPWDGDVTQPENDQEALDHRSFLRFLYAIRCKQLGTLHAHCLTAQKGVHMYIVLWCGMLPSKMAVVGLLHG